MECELCLAHSIYIHRTGDNSSRLCSSGNSIKKISKQKCNTYSRLKGSIQSGILKQKFAIENKSDAIYWNESVHRRRIRKYRKISIIPIFAAAHHHDQMIKDSLWHYFSFYFIRDSFILSFPNIPIPSVQDLPPSPPANLIKACANNISPSGWRDLFGQRLNATNLSLADYVPERQH